MTSGSHDHSSTKVAITTAAIAALATLGAAVITARSSGLPQALFPPTTITATVTQTSTVTQTVTVPVPPPSGTNEPAALAATLYLDDIEPIEESLNKASITWKSQTFSRSLTNPLSGCSARGPVDWVIPSGVDEFESEIGVATDAAEPDSRVTFNVYLDGRMARNETLSVGEHKSIVVALSDASRLRVETIIDQNRRGNCNTEATAVWGDPRLV